jgi:MraZ protein
MFFTGRHAISIEDSGRFSLPASLRAPLRPLGAPEGGETLYVFPSLDRACLEAAGEAYLAGRRRILARMKPFDPRREALERLYFGEARAVQVDAKGRASLPAELRESAGLAGEALCVGMGDRFQIWSPAREGERRAAALAAAGDLLDIEAVEDEPT